jgi:hypothetical protein
MKIKHTRFLDGIADTQMTMTVGKTEKVNKLQTQYVLNGIKFTTVNREEITQHFEQ